MTGWLQNEGGKEVLNMFWRFLKWLVPQSDMNKKNEGKKEQTDNES